MVIIAYPIDINRALGTSYSASACTALVRYTRQYFGLAKNAKVTDRQIAYYLVRVGGNTNTPDLARPPADGYPPDAPLNG